ncbi:hypothetical protein [Neoroseomonas lacus]|uniref:SHOCT domain-containing protein n=1 Tax=Neoroseomonas lacus TaxID=287609 RepID=A0A917KQY9_9PROT|nr:hypothetical protein [Neoroseomonas lacus]GGJ25233.1 hypothetical protein GCM10011320_35770 [Neoroseomonas lacus]
MRRGATLLIVSMLLAACSTGGERTLPMPAADAPIPDGMARITVARASSMLYLGVSAQVMVNDQRAGSLWRGERTFADVPAGPATVAVSGSSVPGRWVTRLPTLAGGRYEIEVAPRGALFAPALMLGYLGTALDAAANVEQGGAFALAIVSAAPPIGTPAPAASPTPIAATAGDRDERLAELRRLRSRGLITDDVYREEQRRVLAPMTGIPAPR